MISFCLYELDWHGPEHAADPVSKVGLKMAVNSFRTLKSFGSFQICASGIFQITSSNSPKNFSGQTAASCHVCIFLKWFWGPLMTSALQSGMESRQGATAPMPAGIGWLLHYFSTDTLVELKSLTGTESTISLCYPQR